MPAERYSDLAGRAIPMLHSAIEAFSRGRQTKQAFADYGMTSSSVQRSLVVPKDALPGFGGLEVSMSSTALNGLEDAVEFDETQWPIVVVTMRGSLTSDDYEGLFERGEAMMARREPCVTVVDLRELTAIADAKQRQRIAEWAVRMDDTYGHVIVGSDIWVWRAGRGLSRYTREPFLDDGQLVWRDGSLEILLTGKAMNSAAARQSPSLNSASSPASAPRQRMSPRLSSIRRRAVSSAGRLSASMAPAPDARAAGGGPAVRRAYSPAARGRARPPGGAFRGSSTPGPWT